MVYYTLKWLYYHELRTLTPLLHRNIELQLSEGNKKTPNMYKGYYFREQVYSNIFHLGIENFQNYIKIPEDYFGLAKGRVSGRMKKKMLTAHHSNIKQSLQYDPTMRRFCINSRMTVLISFVVSPRIHVHKVSYKRWYEAFHNGCITFDDVLVVYLNQVVLSNNYSILGVKIIQISNCLKLW